MNNTTTVHGCKRIPTATQTFFHKSSNGKVFVRKPMKHRGMVGVWIGTFPIGEDFDLHEAFVMLGFFKEKRRAMLAIDLKQRRREMHVLRLGPQTVADRNRLYKEDFA